MAGLVSTHSGDGASTSGYSNSNPNTSVNGTSTKSRSRCTSTNAWILIITIFLAFSTVVNFLHGQYVDPADNTTLRFLHQFLIGSREHTITKTRDHNQHHTLAGLSCNLHGGPFDGSAVENEMVYWSDIPSDYTYQSPFHRANEGKEKFLTFEPDHGGWNNIRMAMETVLVMAHAMGRTLVLPPQQKMYLLHSEKHFTFKDFFHLDTLRDEHEGIKIITMEEFLTRQATWLRDPISNRTVPLPQDRVNWDGRADIHQLWNYLRVVGHSNTEWAPDKCVAAFPATTDLEGVERLQSMISTILQENNGKEPDPHSFTGKPYPVNAPPIDRLRENLGGDHRNKLCIYNTEMHQQTLVHFGHVGREDDDGNTRLLTHFYAFLFFEDWKQDLFYKRLVRDKVRYLDTLMCAAGRIIEAIRTRARQRNATNINGEYDAMHIRRGDFQYKVTRLDPSQIYENSKDQLIEGATVFIATDERKDKRKLLQPLADHYDLVFLEDFQHLYRDIGTNYYGMLDQLVSYKSRVFIGTWFSTFSGYINRLRGYYSVKHKLEGYEQGIVQSWYFAPIEKKFEMQEYRAVRKPIYMREFPTAWRDIDSGIEELNQSEKAVLRDQK